jgi:hypothetical protein
MSSEIQAHNKVPVPKWFWIISVLALAWFLMDTSAFIMRVFMLEETLKSMPEAHQSIYQNIPSWARWDHTLSNKKYEIDHVLV